MYKIEDLFDRRSVVGAKVERILEERDYTKAELCKKAGISRPTLDKLIAGTLTSKTNYEKHISKILVCLEVTPDMLLGNVTNSYSRTRNLRSIMKFTTEKMSEATGISLERLKQIESGEQATVAELRDIAMCLSTSVLDVSGDGYFEPQIATLDYFFRGDEDTAEISGFWGHIGILLDNSSTYLWYPITGNTRKYIYRTIDNEQIVVPCMNNKVLFLNMSGVKEIIMLDEACDQPAYTNWNSDVSCGEIPLVVFEALEDYSYRDEMVNDVLSAKLIDYLERLIEHKGWSEEDINEMTNISAIYYKDGKKRFAEIDFEYNQSIVTEISNAYEYEDLEYTDNVLFFTDLDGSEVFINWHNVSMLEMPLLKVESTIVNNERKVKA